MGADAQFWNIASEKYLFQAPKGVNPADIMVYNAEEGITHLRTREYEPDKTTIVIATDGGHRDKRPGQMGAISSYGVYFGPNSPYNHGARLPFSETQGCHSAEHYAARFAIEFMQNHMWSEGHCLHVNKMVILTDSRPMVVGLTEVIRTWREKGYHKKLEKSITKFDVLFNIDRMMRKLSDQDRHIKFWNVLRCHNTEADRLATQGYELRGSSSFEDMIDRPWKEWTLANTLHKTQAERARSEAVINRITFPLATQDNKWTASIASFLIRRWILNKEYRTEQPLEMMGTIFGPEYRDVFIQEQEKTEIRIAEITHEILELSHDHQNMMQRHQVTELQLRLEICQQILKKLAKHIASIPKESQPDVLLEEIPEEKQPDIPSKDTNRKRATKKDQPNSASQTTQQDSSAKKAQAIPRSVSTQLNPTPKPTKRAQRRKRGRKERKQVLVAEKKTRKRTRK